MEIRQYSKVYETLLFDLLIDEGDDWIEYHGPVGRSKYVKALESSITYIAYYENLVCGYARCREDDGFGVYVYDLLVRKTHRGRQIGKSLMERVCQDFPEQPVYVMSDVDTYYEKLGYRREGSIFEVKANEVRHLWESFWGKLKQEWLNGKHFRTRESAKRAIFWYIEVYYKNYRLHETNGYKTPREYAV